MMRTVVIVLLALSTHFALTPFAPAPTGNATIFWPFAADSQPVLAGIGGLPRESGSIVTPLLAGVAAVAFAIAVITLLGVTVPEDWWAGSVIIGAAASIVLYALYFSPLSILPIFIDLLLVWGILVRKWSVTALKRF